LRLSFCLRSVRPLVNTFHDRWQFSDWAWCTFVLCGQGHGHFLTQTSTRLLYNNTLNPSPSAITTPKPCPMPFNQQFRFLLVLNQRAARAQPGLRTVCGASPAEIAYSADAECLPCVWDTDEKLVGERGAAED
jgi:hypothetical protein